MRILNSCGLYAHSQFLCTLARFDFANPAQQHTVYARRLVFDKTSAQPHFAVVNCSDAVMSVFYFPVLNAQTDIFAIMNCCVAA